MVCFSKRSFRNRHVGHLKQFRLGLLGIFDPQVFIGSLRGNATLRSTIKETQLEQIGFDHIHNGLGFFANGGGDSVQPNRTAVIFLDNSFQDTPVQVIQAERVDCQQVEASLATARVTTPSARTWE